jgi:hypothetical protein
VHDVAMIQVSSELMNVVKFVETEFILLKLTTLS